MEPVIGLDVAKGESQIQAFLARKQPFGKTFKFTHDTNGLRDFYVFYKEVKLSAETDPVVNFESTGSYQEPVLQFLEERRMTYYIKLWSLLVRCSFNFQILISQQTLFF